MINDPINANDVDLREQYSGQAVPFYRVRLSARDAWFGTTVAALFNMLGMLLEMGMIRNIPGISPTPAALSSLVGLMILAVLFIRRKTPSVRWASVLYLLNTASVVTVFALSDLQFAVSEKHWVPFQASKLGCLIAAMVAPGFWVGLSGILAYTVSALLQLEIFFPPEMKAQLADEFWPILAFCLGGVLALAYRFRRAQLEQELAWLQAQNFALRRLANAFLNIRDLMNTPLQVIELSVDVLRHSYEPSRTTLERIDRSVQSLREINTVLIQHEKRSRTADEKDAGHRRKRIS
jgi:hypothetical protein